jgi:hypothetical protein
MSFPSFGRLREYDERRAPGSTPPGSIQPKLYGFAGGEQRVVVLPPAVMCAEHFTATRVCTRTLPPDVPWHE